MKVKERRLRNRKQIYQVILIALFSALGYLLMMLGKVVPFFTFSFLEVEISDLSILLAYSFIGYIPSLLVAIIKTLLTALTFGFVGVPIPIGQITALISSFFYATFLMLADKLFSFMTFNLKKRIFLYAGISILNSVILTYLNYLFITPTFLTYGDRFLTCFDLFKAPEGSELNEAFNSYFGVVSNSYTAAIFAIYIPFNLLKAVLIFFVYEILLERAIKPLLKNKDLPFNLKTVRKKNYSDYVYLKLKKASKEPLFTSHEKSLTTPPGSNL